MSLCFHRSTIGDTSEECSCQSSLWQLSFRKALAFLTSSSSLMTGPGGNRSRDDTSSRVSLACADTTTITWQQKSTRGRRKLKTSSAVSAASCDFVAWIFWAPGETWLKASRHRRRKKKPSAFWWEGASFASSPPDKLWKMSFLASHENRQSTLEMAFWSQQTGDRLHEYLIQWFGTVKNTHTHTHGRE